MGKKAQMIMKEKPDKVKVEREFFEINLMNMEEFDMADLGIADDKEQTSPDKVPGMDYLQTHEQLTSKGVKQ